MASLDSNQYKRTRASATKENKIQVSPTKKSAHGRGDTFEEVQQDEKPSGYHKEVVVEVEQLWELVERLFPTHPDPMTFWQLLSSLFYDLSHK